MNNLKLLVQQLEHSSNKTQSIMNLLKQNNQNIALYNQIMQMNEQERAQKIAEACNRNKISKDDLLNLIGMNR